MPSDLARKIEIKKLLEIDAEATSDMEKKRPITEKLSDTNYLDLE